MPDAATSRAGRHLQKLPAFGSYEVYGAELFREAAQKHSAAYHAHMNSKHELDFAAFCALVRERERGVHSEDELRRRFTRIDRSGSGSITTEEYFAFTLRDSLSAASQRLIDLFRAWDTDGTGQISREEFTEAIRRLQYDVPGGVQGLETLFTAMDADRSGKISYEELEMMLHTATIDRLPGTDKLPGWLANRLPSARKQGRPLGLDSARGLAHSGGARHGNRGEDGSASGGIDPRDGGAARESGAVSGRETDTRLPPHLANEGGRGGGGGGGCQQ